MKLRDVLACITPKSVTGPDQASGGPLPDTCMDRDIAAVHYRAQDVIPGGLFVAVPGSRADGNVYVPMALARGAQVIVSERPTGVSGAVLIEVENARCAMARIAARFYGDPSRDMVVVAITGTNGKTTTAFLIESILKKAGFAVGVIGTLNARYHDTILDIGMTTPESVDLQRILHDMKAAGVTHVVMEASSHAIALERIEGCRLDVGILTNVTQDHLDFHKDMQTYWEAKRKLFTRYLATQPFGHRSTAVVNRNDPRGRELCRELDIPVLDTGFEEDCKVRSILIRNDTRGLEAVIVTPSGLFRFTSPLIGRHNLENILCASATGVALGLSLKIIREGIESVFCVPGRLERIPNPLKRLVTVDYAHTPDALEHVLSTLNQLIDGRLICVFGCGGDRDTGKRPIMGRIAAKWADAVVVTSDNPRSENPIAIIDAIVDGLVEGGWHVAEPNRRRIGKQRRQFWVEPDRRKAIRLAISLSSRADAVLIAGKGHETYQIIGTERLPFDDRMEAGLALKELISPGSRKGEKPSRRLKNAKP